ncbi:MAG TPA: bifunctional [glutamate--ammonia ligase]-adenylyl-L-tyrosine phosphorylase/[glutamate--ammonia-ligase] adenylyltransferase [Gemmataceae bacterium]|nr:bifunctional [glutamate--ammonia ligase]-adenylyl-L-tyrosine phosphorylase/[glutamate--ammonia-ligase] adenylyltransferase [Gemmataceae bacterium]
MTQLADPARLDRWGVNDRGRGTRNLEALARHLGPPLAELLPHLGRSLPDSPDPDLALNALERFFANRTARAQLPALLADDAAQLHILVQLFGTSQFLGDVLAADPDFLETATASLRVTPTPDELVARLTDEVASAGDDAGVLRAFRRFRRREVLRIGVNDIIRDRPLEEVTADLSRVADAAITVAWERAVATLRHRHGEPRTAADHPTRAAVVAFGKLGGGELNYSSDIDLMVVYDEEGRTSGRRGIGNDEFFGRAASELIRLLSAHTDRGQAFRVDFRLRPEGQRGPLARSLGSTLGYYDTLGRTWERQALIKARPVAGNPGLGAEFVEAVQPFVYKRFLSFAEINEIKAIKRKVELQAQRARGGREVKTGPGGIRDIEFAIQFLQLLNGGDLSPVRCRDTLGALQALEAAGCLTDAEYRGLDDAYRFLRKVEHRLQLLFDLQTHRLPERQEELRKLALRMGYGTSTQYPVPNTEGKPGPASGQSSVPRSVPGIGSSGLAPQRHSPLDEPSRVPSLDTRDLLVDPLDRFLHDVGDKTRLNRTILDHLLHQTFRDTDDATEPESDLILEPDPDESTVRAVLGKFGFRDVPAAWRNLTRLAQEQPFLSTRRCRHFLANIAPQLLRAVAATTDPDAALNNLEQVTASLGGKAVLWELFSFNRPSLKLYVDICDSPFLSRMLVNNPGMIDDLLDSLILNRPRDLADLRGELAELLRGAGSADAVESILHSFQDKEVLRIAVRDLLGKDDIRAVTAALSDLAEMLLGDVAAREAAAMRDRFGDAGPYAILAMGKLGGREMNYHSDLDLVIVYHGEGRTAGPKPLDHYEYFTEYARRLIKALSQHGPLGRLYAVDMRLRPTGQSGSLVVPLEEFRRYYEPGGGAQVWERQSLTRARPVHGDAAFAAEVASAVRAATFAVPWGSAVLAEIRAMRERLEATAPPRSLKRGRGGMTDVEFLVQAFQLKHGAARPEIVRSNTWDCLDALWAAGLLAPADHQALGGGYSFHRLAEARLRIVTNRPLNEYPEAPHELEKLARRMGSRSGDQFLAERNRHAEAVRETFLRLLQQE